MSQHYSNPERASDPHALPDVEVFYISEKSRGNFDPGHGYVNMPKPGWYWWYCFPGCLPDGEANGPFKSEVEAVADLDAQWFEGNM